MGKERRVNRQAKRRHIDAAITHQGNRIASPGSHQQTRQFAGHTLTRQRGGKPGMGAQRGDSFGIRASAGKCRHQTAIAQHPQRILANTLASVTNKSQTPGPQIRLTIERIGDAAVSTDINGVDGEIAPAGILLPVSAECDGGVTAIRVNVNTCLRDLDGGRCRGTISGAHGDRAMPETGFNDPKTGLAEDFSRLFNRHGNRHVDIARLPASQKITHRTTDNACLGTGISRQCENLLGKGRDGKAVAIHHYLIHHHPCYHHSGHHHSGRLPRNRQMKSAHP